jgi:hypothetical protein
MIDSTRLQTSALRKNSNLDGEVHIFRKTSLLLLTLLQVANNLIIYQSYGVKQHPCKHKVRRKSRLHGAVKSHNLHDRFISLCWPSQDFTNSVLFILNVKKCIIHIYESEHKIWFKKNMHNKLLVKKCTRSPIKDVLDLSKFGCILDILMGRREYNKYNTVIHI